MRKIIGKIGGRELALFSWVYLVQFCSCNRPSFLTSEDFANAGENSVDTDVTFLTDEDFIRGQQLTAEQLNRPAQKKLYNQKYFRGDIVGKASWKLTKRPGIRRNGVRSELNKWPGGTIPYVISGSNSYDASDRAVISRAMAAYRTRTCINWVPRSSERDYVYIGKIDGCYSDVGKAGGRQELSLDDGCITYDTAIHEMMHAVGFWHEHERWDRDQYINVIWNNVKYDSRDQFGRVNLRESDYYNEKYDYYSIMHYDKNSFSKNGQNTMEVKPSAVNGVANGQQAQQLTEIIGRVKDFSPADLRKINSMYRCRGTNTGTGVNTYTYSPVVQPQPVVYTQSPVVQPYIPPYNTPAPYVPPYIPPYNTPAPYVPPYVPPYNTPAPYIPPYQPQTQRPYVQPYTPQPFATQNPFGNINQACQDRSTLCNLYTARCRSPSMQNIMRTFCARTCGFCFGG